MAGKFLALSASKVLQGSAKPKLNPFAIAKMSNYSKQVIGRREIVGFGFNGEPNYVDRDDFPMPAIRWREPTPDILALREKEKGDWKNLTIEEKKALYRYSFCQTFAEFSAPTGEWKSAVGMSLVIISLGVWAYFGLKYFVYPPLPETFDKEHREAQFRRILDLQMNPVEGISSKWDYEKDQWK